MYTTYWLEDQRSSHDCLVLSVNDGVDDGYGAESRTRQRDPCGAVNVHWLRCMRP